MSTICRECNDSMKESLAAALRHSRRQGEYTYDRRTFQEKKEPAMELAQAALKAEEDKLGIESDESESDDDLPLRAVTGERKEIPVGSFVALKEERSTLSKPAILLGRIQRYPNKHEASLLWYKPVGKGCFALQLDGDESWVESIDALLPVKTAVDKRSGNIRLLKTLRSIHKHLSN